MSGCVHPFLSMRAIAIKGTEDKPSVEVEIFFICELCGMHLVMLSKGVEAKPKLPQKRVPYLTFQFRKFFTNMTGNTYAEVIEKFHLTFKNQHKSDADIIALFKRVQGIQ